jgi:PQQ-like domain
MRFSTRLSVVAALAIAGLVPAVTAAAVSLPHARPATSVAGITSGTAPLWAERFKGAEGNTAGFADAVSPDGSTVYVTGSTGVNLPHPHTSGATVAYNSATGAVLWQTQYNTLNFRNFSFNDIAVNPDGSAVYATGEVTGSHHPGIINAVTAAYNASTGAQLWVVHFHQRAQNIAGTAIAVSPDGSKVFVAGITTAKSGDGEIGTAAYDATTGALLWIGSYSPAGYSGIGRSIAITPDGSKVFTVGAIWPGIDNNNPNTMVTAAYSS